jgi:predicted enzyme related to lactoylglutathione lyase
MANPVVHWEIGARDAAKQQAFYAELFGWQVNTQNPMNYGVVVTGGPGGINGGIFQPPAGAPFVMIYVQVDDLQASLDRAVGLGGKVAMGPTPIPGVGSIACFQDPEGNMVGLFRS